MSAKHFHKRKRLRKGRITYRKRKQKLIDGKIIEQFHEVGSETDVSIDCPLFELPHSLLTQEVREAAFLEDLRVPPLLTSKDMVSRMQQLNFVEIIESDTEELESGSSKCSKRKRMKMNRRKTVSDSLVQSDTDSNEELSVETARTPAGLQTTGTPLQSPYQASAAHITPFTPTSSSSKSTDTRHKEATHLDADDEESTFETVLYGRALSPDVAMKDLSAQVRNKEKRHLLRDPELVNRVITQFVESSQDQLAISSRIDKFGFRIIRCLSLAHGVKVRLLEHCHFGWCPLLERTDRSRVGDRALLEPMLNLLREEARLISRRQKPRKNALADTTVSTQ